ncbi:BRO1 domain-containing protein [Cokeromyces recurvatus]|uniref:BRO1 domain-containing protein n=1 Tax=Cokeromyces recurvatus TaxID=90255 RepID=UPI00221EB832|nr:BRO1 domain-containing protein [Cokeromyces recurvatus]KAI7900737.1 BRO1 domain-containing protein [Cokeromyces recurvatus]
MSFPYSLPTTGSLSFADYLETTAPYSSEISDATAQRGRLRAVLKELKKENQSTRDYQLLINIIEEYLPYLISIVNCIETKKLQLKKSIETSWRSTLSDHLIHTGSNAPRISCIDIQYELIFVLMTYAYALSLQVNNDLSKQEPATNKMADMLNTAAGVFQFVANEVIPTWKQSPDNRPVETVREFPVALSKMALADAQSISINRALATNNVSKSLIAKLFIGVAGQYEMACSLISTLNQDISTELKKYLADGTLFYKALAKKYLAMDANDNQKMGQAVGFARECKAELNLIHHSSLSKPHIRKSAIAARAAKEKEAISELVSKYTMINNTVSYEPVPTRQELQKLIPGGRGLLELKNFVLPDPIFGPSVQQKSEKSYLLEGRYF